MRIIPLQYQLKSFIQFQRRQKARLVSILCQIFMVERIIPDQHGMESSQSFQLCRFAFLTFLQCLQVFPGDRVVVIQIHIIADYVVITFFVDTIAEVYIGKAVREILFIESADLSEDIGPDHNACARERKDIADALVEAKIPDLIVAPVLKLVNRSVRNGHNTGVLNNVGAGIQKLHTACADLRKLCLFGQMREPAVLAHNNVVMQEHQHLSIGTGGPHIVHAGHIERHFLVYVHG